MPESINISLLGRGKTGSQVENLLKEKGHNTTVFSSTHPPTLEKLLPADIIISFVPGDVFNHLLPLLLESRRPIVCGSTGVEWPLDLDSRLKEQGIPWVWGSNFAMGMLLIRQMLAPLEKVPQIFSDYHVKIQETHHQHKQDAPSGTGLKWREWSSLEPEIESFRKGDLVGEHGLILRSSSGEKIVLTHEATNRKLFASGALWTAEQVLSAPPEGGLHFFETFASERLFGNF